VESVTAFRPEKFSDIIQGGKQILLNPSMVEGSRRWGPGPDGSFELVLNHIKEGTGGTLYLVTRASSLTTPQNVFLTDKTTPLNFPLIATHTKSLAVFDLETDLGEFSNADRDFIYADNRRCVVIVYEITPATTHREEYKEGNTHLIPHPPVIGQDDPLGGDVCSVVGAVNKNALIITLPKTGQPSTAVVRVLMDALGKAKIPREELRRTGALNAHTISAGFVSEAARFAFTRKYDLLNYISVHDLTIPNDNTFLIHFTGEVSLEILAGITEVEASIPLSTLVLAVKTKEKVDVVCRGIERIESSLAKAGSKPLVHKITSIGGVYFFHEGVTPLRKPVPGFGLPRTAGPVVAVMNIPPNVTDPADITNILRKLNLEVDSPDYPPRIHYSSLGERVIKARRIQGLEPKSSLRLHRITAKICRIPGLYQGHTRAYQA
jgi:hypothetical protein